MINMGLIRRACREMAPTTLLCAVLLATISGLLAYALPQFQARVIQRAMPPAFMQMRNVMLGVDAERRDRGYRVLNRVVAPGGDDPAAGTGDYRVYACQRGEIDAGSIDMLMGLPISRRQLFMA